MKHGTLGDVVLDALEEYKPTQQSKLTRTLNRKITKYPERIIYGSAAALGVAGYFLAPWAFNQLKSPGTYLLPDKIQTLRCIGAITLAAADVAISMDLVYHYSGARIYSKTEYKHDKKHKKIGKFFRYPKTLGFGLGIALTALRLPHNILPPYENKELALLGLYVGALGGALSTMAYILREIEHKGKQGWKEIGSVFLSIPAKIAGITSTDKKISMLEKIIEKNDSSYLKFLLASTLQKKSLFESLNYSKEVLDQIKNRPESQDYVKLKKWSTGVVAKYLFKKKQSWVATFDFLKKIQKVDNEAAKTIVRSIRKSIPDDNLDEHFLLDYYSKDFIEKDHEIPWVDFAHMLKSRAAKDKNIKRFASSEAINVWVYTGSKLIGRSVVVKEYDFDFFERFLKQRFEHEALRYSGIKTENPLVFMREGERSTVLTTREGDSNLREYLKDKSKEEKRQAFEKLIRQSLRAQKLLFKRVRKEGDGFYADVMHENRPYSVRINVLNPESDLLHRAFLGDKKRGKRFGENPHLREAVAHLNAYRQEKYMPLIITCNHGDPLGPNFTELLARLDARHIIADTLYDPTYSSFDTSFLIFDKDKKAEVTFRELSELYDFRDEGRFINSFDYFYLHNGLCLSASRQSYNDPETAAMILDKVLEFSKGKRFERPLRLYLKDSEASKLLKII